MGTNPESTPPNRLAERYRIESSIGAGSHAITWRGWDERLQRPVAIKILRSQLARDPIFVQRFAAEARAAAAVHHTNVVDVYDFGQEGETLYIVMQLVEGEDLRSYMDRVAPASRQETRRIVTNILDGLGAIHAAGIIHRDIKPQNILIGPDGIARVTDFGIADIGSSEHLTREGLTLGTVDYMSPEQAQGLPLTAASDLYATGVVLYEMLTGTLPFHGESPRATMLQHINGHVTPPSVRLPGRGLDGMIDAVVLQSLARDPARRFGTASAMRKAVNQALAPPRPARLAAPARTSAPSPGIPYRAYEYVDTAEDEGNALNSAFRGIIILLLIGVLGVGLWGAAQVLRRMDINIPLPSAPSIQITRPAPTVPPSGSVVDNQLPTQVPGIVDNEQQDGVQAGEIEPLPPQELPPIEPIGAQEETPEETAPVIEPSGFDGTRTSSM